MLISTPSASIYLHRPRSSLIFAPIQESTPCTRPERWTAPVSAEHVHALKTIKAADNISSLITLPISLTNHSPFFTCTIALGTIAHLSAYSTIMYSDDGGLLKERIQLAIGALKRFGEIWPVAESILAQVKEVAKSVFAFDPASFDLFVNEPLEDPKNNANQFL